MSGEAFWKEQYRLERAHWKQELELERDHWKGILEQERTHWKRIVRHARLLIALLVVTILAMSARMMIRPIASSDAGAHGTQVKP